MLRNTFRNALGGFGFTCSPVAVAPPRCEICGIRRKMNEGNEVSCENLTILRGSPTTGPR
jgi:hypothetical protein